MTTTSDGLNLVLRSVSSLRANMAALLAGALILTAPAASSAVESDATNREFLRWCGTNPAACEKEAKQQAKSSAMALKILGIQTGRCVAEFPENINVEVLTNVSLNYIRNTADPDEDLSWSFTQALMETFPCSE